MEAGEGKVTKKKELEPQFINQQPLDAQGRPVPPPPAAPVESKTWRLTGRIIIDQVVYFLIDSEGGSRKVPLKSCDRDDDLLNWRCHVDGEIVAGWTGPPPPVFNQYFSALAAPTQ